MSLRASIAALSVVLGSSAAPAALAHDFPTVDRVQYVLECMYNNGGSSVYVYKCSCVIDTIAKKYTYEQWTDASMITRYQTMPGEGMGLFRDAPEERKIAKQYRADLAEAKKACAVPK
jgi:hypothetical protein